MGHITQVGTNKNSEKTYFVLGTHTISYKDEDYISPTSVKYLRCVDANGQEADMRFNVLADNGHAPAIKDSVAYVERGDKIIVRNDGKFIKNLTIENLKNEFIKSR